MMEETYTAKPAHVQPAQQDEVEESVLSEIQAANDEQHMLPILPLKNIVTLPTGIVPVIVGRKSSIAAVQKALKEYDKTIFVTAQKHPDTEHPQADDLFTFGTKSVILQMMKMPNGALKILLEGMNRAKIEQVTKVDTYLCAQIEDLESTNTDNKVKIEAAWRQLKQAYLRYAKLNSKVPQDLVTMTRSTEDKDCVTDTIAVHANLAFHDRQHLLETTDLPKRMIDLSIFLKKEIEILQAEQRIKGRVQTQVEKNQREYYLHEQIKAIYKELGREDHMEEVESLRKKLNALQLPSDALDKSERELRKLEQMPPMSAESGLSKNYIEWVLSLPWHKASKDSVSLLQAQRILDKDHAGLKKIKERIVEYLAAKKFNKDLKRTPTICFVGPPGVGKSSLAVSIAKSLNREFVRISLGGVRDEAEIRGHRRTYIGALPGKILQAMKKAKTVNPVILLDEIDKMSRDMTGDPGSALLEVLDPEQNKNFVDHFLEAEYDLSQVMFIATANMLDTIPYPLFDRMELIQLSGYTKEEKLHIFKNFLLPKYLKTYGLTKKQLRISDDVVHDMIEDYSKESGVRQLSRLTEKIIRKTIQELLSSETKKSVTITTALLEQWLGYTKFKKTDLNPSKEKIGIATGLAWTEMGGEVLEIETSVLPGKGGFTLTGQLGEVMQESAQAAHSYIRSRAKDFGISRAVFNNKDIHIHLPEGATPKDGPSAGITMSVALISALTNIPVQDHVAMTGEVTLRGRVLGVGGLKEKILAAQQYKCSTVIVPKSNEPEVKEALEDIDTSDIQIIFVDHMDQVVEHAFTQNPFTKKKSIRRVKKKTT